MRVEFDGFIFDSELRVLTHRGPAVHLTPKCFQLLLLLLESRPRPVAAAAIMESVWPGCFVARGSLANLVLELRTALGDDGRSPRYIRTVHRYGYVFSGPTSPPAPFDAVKAVARCRLVLPEGQVPLREGETTIGRSPDCTVLVDCQGVSRRHARLVLASGRATIDDLHSRNGTFVNGIRIEKPTPLTDGDGIGIGSISLVFRVGRTDATTDNLVLSIGKRAF